MTLAPPCDQWPALLARRPTGELFGRPLEQWRKTNRHELGLDVDRPIIATGHQTLLWHPGILAKYLVVDGFAAQHDLARANLIVDQHAEGFGSFEIPVRRPDGALAVRRLELCRPPPRQEVPMCRHEAFTPPDVPEPLQGAWPSVEAGVQRIFEAVHAHRKAVNAAMQMAQALTDLMRPWCRPMPGVCSSDLMRTSLARAMLEEMARDPQRCVECYNRAVSSLPEAGIPSLLIREEYVEVPLWRVRPDGRRMHAYDSDIQAEVRGQKSEVSEKKSEIQNPKSKIALLPRALFMTALVRLCMCDLFIHGTGGAGYDRAMERWIKDWLGVEVGSKAVATATLRLPLLTVDSQGPDVSHATLHARRVWHDPETRQQSSPGPIKRQWLDQINASLRRSSDRKALFLRMHERLNELRSANGEAVLLAQEQAERARQQADDVAIGDRRDWAFPLYPPSMIDDLADTLRNTVVVPEPTGIRPGRMG